MVNKRKLIELLSIISVGIAGALLAIEGFGLGVSSTIVKLLGWPAWPIMGITLTLKGIVGLGALLVFIEYIRKNYFR